jgi:hypothetical protein
MIRGNLDVVPAPFKFRVLVPYLASLLPLAPEQSLRVISYASFFLTYLVLLLACRRLGLNLWASAAGLMLAFAPPWHLVGYHNPFLVDGFGLAMVSIMCYALMHDSFRGFLLAAIFGALAREQVALFACLWVLKDVRKGLVAAGAVAIVVLLPHIELSNAGAAAVAYHPPVAAIVKSRLSQMGSFLSELYRAGELAWLVLPAGLVLVPLRKVPLLAALAIISGGTALLTSFAATDVIRMCGILTPALAVAAASLFHALWSEKRKALLGLGLVLAASQALLSSAGSWLVEGPLSAQLTLHIRHALWLLDFAYAAGVVYALRHRLRHTGRAAAAELMHTARRIRDMAAVVFGDRRASPAPDLPANSAAATR